MTRVHGKRGRLIHATDDLRNTLCKRSCDGWIVEPDKQPTCIKCLQAMTK